MCRCHTISVYGIARFANDCATEVLNPEPISPPVNPLEVAPPAAPVDALEQVRLDGAIFFRGELTESWSFDSPLREMAGVIRPGATRLILFHIVVHGRCWTAVDGGDRHWVEQGDVIVLPYGDDYLMGGVEPAERVPILSLLAPPPWATMPVLTHGSGGARTDVVCGYLQSQDPLFDPSIRAFPPVFVVRLPDGPAAQWVASSIKFALDATTRISPTTPVSTRLPELLLIEVLLQHFADAPVSDHGWIAALRDPVLASAMTVVGLGTTRMWHLAVRSNGNAVARQVRGARTLGEFAQRLIAPGVCSTVGMLPSPERRTGTRCAPRKSRLRFWVRQTYEFVSNLPPERRPPFSGDARVRRPFSGDARVGS